jgi:KAP family P-loop domain
MLDSGGLRTPLTVGIYGGWGAGKTSVMLTLEERLAQAPDRLMLWFDAWVYAWQEEALWRALLLCVVEALRRRTMPPDGQTLQGEAYDQALRAFDQLWLSETDAEKARHELDEARTSLYRSLAIKERGGVRINWWGALPLAVDAALTALTAGLTKQVAEAIAGKDAEGGLITALAK